MATALKTRDLLLFDQRGTGNSDPLSCPALEGGSFAALDRISQRCAEQIGPARRAFTTQETVADIEALRQAAGYQKLVLAGTSYGTKVALEYAERYPEHVEALLLDSVVGRDGPEPLGIPTLQAISPVISQLCSQLLCAGITRNPLGDLSALTARLRRHSIKGSVYDGIGRRHTSRLDELGLLGILTDGDLNPALRALVPASVHSALHGDPDPLLRLQALADGLIPNVPSAQRPPGRTDYGGDEINEALFAVTTCEEIPFPWQRGASASTRDAEALAFVRAQPASVFAPFDAATALGGVVIHLCDRWPNAALAPPAPTALPNVPTLILSGEQDLRTPTSTARAVAALIPDAQLLTVPFTGHSVVGSDLSDCTAKALSAFFGGLPVAPCGASKDILPPTPLPPRSLSGVRAPAGLPGRPGKTVVAVLDTIHDLGRQVLAATIQAGSKLPSGASFGGLRGGYTRLGHSSVTLRAYSFIAGVQLTGTFQVRGGRLLSSTIAVGGPSAAPGVVRYGSEAKRVVGVLGGRPFSLSQAKVRLARAAPGGEWPASAPLFGGPGR
jgi:pimeloyl-ACP methyl ester carboxylesterase